MGQCASSLQHYEETATAPTTSSTLKSKPRTVCSTASSNSDRNLSIVHLEMKNNPPQKEITEDTLRATRSRKKKIRKNPSRCRNFCEQDRQISPGRLTASRGDLIRGNGMASPYRESAWQHLGYAGTSKSTKAVVSSLKSGRTHTSIGSWGSLSIQEEILQKVDNAPLLQISMNDVSGNTVPTQCDCDDISDLDSQWGCIPITIRSDRRRNHADLPRRAPLPTRPFRKSSHRSSIYLPKNPARSKVRRNGVESSRERHPRQHSQKKVAAHPKPLSPWNPHRLPSTKDYREQLR